MMDLVVEVIQALLDAAFGELLAQVQGELEASVAMPIHTLGKVESSRSTLAAVSDNEDVSAALGAEA